MAGLSQVLQATPASSPASAPPELPAAEYVPLDDPFVTPIGVPHARRKGAQAPLAIDGSERRRLPRKTTLMAGVIADLNGDDTSDCTILDMNVRGAQIRVLKNLPTGGQIYLLDTCNRAAYLAAVVWNRADHAGLSFLRGCAVKRGMPPTLRFLSRLLLESKLRDIERLIANGLSVGLAFNSVGLAEEHLHQMAPDASGDEKFEQAVIYARRLLSK